MSDYRKGLLQGFLCYLIWGLFPIYWHWLRSVDSFEILAHRMVWSCVFMVLFFCVIKGIHLKYYIQRRHLPLLLLTGGLMTFNWGLYIWAINHHYILESSLGYYINPLLNVLLGTLFLRERLTRWQFLALLFAAGGVIYFTVDYGRFPLISISLATSFAIYGLLKKKMQLNATAALTVESMWMMPAAAAYIIFLCSRGQSALCHFDPVIYLLLFGAGAVTAIPLLLFGKAAERIPLSTLGFLQYVSPTGQFLLGILLYHEEFSSAHLVCFCCIWVGLVIYSVDMLLQAKRGRI